MYSSGDLVWKSKRFLSIPSHFNYTITRKNVLFDREGFLIHLHILLDRSGNLHPNNTVERIYSHREINYLLVGAGAFDTIEITLGSILGTMGLGFISSTLIPLSMMKSMASSTL